MAKTSLGIVGLPNVGKSTLFKLLTKQDILIANYPFATIDPNVGVIAVPDERLDKLNALSNSKKKIPAIVEFYDIAGLVKGANKGEGLGNQFLSHIRETQAIVIVLRVFKNDDIVHVENSVDPLRDMDIINAELALKDLETVEKRLVKVEGESRSGNKDAVKDKEFLLEIQSYLNSGRPIAGNADLRARLGESVRLADMNLLSAKRQIYLLNGAQEEVSEPLVKAITGLNAEYVVADLGKGEGVSDLVVKTYKLLDLISFFTTGEDETRAWTIRIGTKAPQAAGVIHTDFEKKFIRLEVVSSADLLALGGWNQAKQKGKLRLEGKEYEVKDGDVIVVRHG